MLADTTSEKKKKKKDITVVVVVLLLFARNTLGGGNMVGRSTTLQQEKQEQQQPHLMAEVEACVPAAPLAMLSVGFGRASTPNTSLSVLTCGKEQLNGSVRTEEDNNNDDGYNTSAEQTADDSRASSSSESCTGAFCEKETRGRSENDAAGERGEGAAADGAKEPETDVVVVTATDDDDDDDLRMMFLGNKRTRVPIKASESSTSNIVPVTPRRSRLWCQDSSQEESVLSLGAVRSDGFCADRHPLPMCNSDSPSTSTGRTRSRLEEQNRKLAGCKLLECGTSCGGERSGVRRRRVMNGRPPTSPSLLGTSGDLAKPVNKSVYYRVDSSMTSIGGHHVTVLKDGVFMKESCSRREERFYEFLKPVQDYVCNNPDLYKALYYPLFFDDVEDDHEGHGEHGVYHDESEDGDESANERESAWRWDLWRRQHGVGPSVEGECSALSSNGGTSTMRGEDVERKNAVPAALKGQYWDALLPLIPFVPRFVGIRRVHFDAYGKTCREPKEEAPPADSADGKKLMYSNSTDAVGGGSDERRRKEGEKEGDVRQMIALEDLCNGFKHPCVLDIKMGTRQYGLNPSEAKLRSKKLKAAMSTSMQYGVRLAGMRRWCPDTQQYETQSKVSGRRLSLDELRETVMRFTQHSKRLRLSFRRQVHFLRRAFARQHVFRFFTSSLLFVYDADRPLLSSRIVMVDFAFTYEREELRRGGDPEAAHEQDVGYIKALDTMLAILA